MRILILILWLWIFYALWQLFRRSVIKRAEPEKPEKSAQGEDMVQDPHCGTYVPRSLGVKKVIKGRSFYFCSEECRDAYKPHP